LGILIPLYESIDLLKHVDAAKLSITLSKVFNQLNRIEDSEIILSKALRNWQQSNWTKDIDINETDCYLQLYLHLGDNLMKRKRYEQSLVTMKDAIKFYSHCSDSFKVVFYLYQFHFFCYLTST